MKKSTDASAAETAAWLLLGPELGSQKAEYDTLCANIEKSVQKRGGEKAASEIERRKFIIGADEVSDITDAIMSYSLFASHKIITVEQIDAAPAAAATAMARALANAGEGTYVIFCGEGTKVPAALEAAVPKARKKVFWNLSETDYVRYALERAQQRGVHLTRPAAESLVHLAGEHTQELDAMISSIALYEHALSDAAHDAKQDAQQDASADDAKPARGMIDKEDIERWMAHYKPESVFSLFDALSEGRYQNSTDILASLLLANESPAQIIAGLVYQLKIALRLQHAVAGGTTFRTAFESLGIRSYSMQDRYRNFISGLSAAALEAMLCACVKTDADFREGYESRYHPLLLSVLLNEIISLRRN